MFNPEAAVTDHPAPPQPGAKAALTLSTLAFMAAFAVWTIFSIIGVKIKKDLGLSDAEFGLLAAHDFTDDDGSRRYGREVDLVASVPPTEILTAEVRAAVFDGARPGFADRHKVWLTLEAKY